MPDPLEEHFSYLSDRVKIERYQAAISRAVSPGATKGTNTTNPFTRPTPSPPNAMSVISKSSSAPGFAGRCVRPVTWAEATRSSSFTS